MDRRRRRRGSESSEDEGGNYFKYSSNGSSDAEENRADHHNHDHDHDHNEEEDFSDAEAQIMKHPGKVEGRAAAGQRDEDNGDDGDADADDADDADEEEEEEEGALENQTDPAPLQDGGEKDPQLKQPKEVRSENRGREGSSGQEPRAAPRGKRNQRERDGNASPRNRRISNSKGRKGEPRERKQDSATSKPRAPAPEGRVIASFPMPPNWNREPVKEIDLNFRPARSQRAPGQGQFQPSSIKKREGFENAQRDSRGQEISRPEQQNLNSQNSANQQVENQKQSQRSKRYTSQRAGDEQTSGNANSQPNLTGQQSSSLGNQGSSLNQYPYLQNQNSWPVPLYVPPFPLPDYPQQYNYYTPNSNVYVGSPPSFPQGNNYFQVQYGKRPVKITTPDNKEVDLRDLASS